MIQINARKRSTVRPGDRKSYAGALRARAAAGKKQTQSLLDHRGERLVSPRCLPLDFP